MPALKRIFLLEKDTTQFLQIVSIFIPFMQLNWVDVFKKIENISEAFILVSKEYSNLVENIYDKIVEHKKEINLFIINADNIICSLKHKKTDLVILLGVECPEHGFENAIYLQDKLGDEEIKHINTFSNVYFDSTYLQYKSHSYIQNQELLVVTKNEAILRYFSRKMHVKPFYNFDIENRFDYLTRRINLAEIAKNNKTFAIIFVHETYLSLAVKIKKSLENRERCGYLLFLRNIRYSRLVTIENIDTLVLIDCPAYDNFNIDVTLPILSPADVQYILSKKWDPKYEINKFDISVENCKEKDICIYQGAGKLILDSDFFGVEFSSKDDDDLEIYEGKSGIASEYTHE